MVHVDQDRNFVANKIGRLRRQPKQLFQANVHIIFGWSQTLSCTRHRVSCCGGIYIFYFHLSLSQLYIGQYIRFCDTFWLNCRKMVKLVNTSSNTCNCINLSDKVLYIKIENKLNSDCYTAFLSRDD